MERTIKAEYEKIHKQILVSCTFIKNY